jgi:glucose-6-phosphate isomerase
VSKIKVGDIVECVVTGVQSYGAFVLIDNSINGLIHISEISKGYVRNIEDFVKVGETVYVKILELDEEDLRAKVSLKEIREVNKRERYTKIPRSRHKINLKKYSCGVLFERLNSQIEETYNLLEDKVMLRVDLTHTGIEQEIKQYSEKVKELHKVIHEKTGAGNDFLGWVDWPKEYDYEEVNAIIEASKKINEECDTLVVCGIGGSYLGAASAIEMLNGLFSDSKVKIIFMGNTFSSTYTAQVLKYLEDKEFAINVISKSGTTTETSIAFRLVKELAIKKYGKAKANSRIYATTDKARGALKNESNIEGYKTFVIPDDIGGRYSVLTAVGLLPIAVSGQDIREILAGAAQARLDFENDNLENNAAYQYAVARYVLNKKGYPVEMFVTYEPHFQKLGEWWKQLFGESEGKEGKGLLPDSVTYSTDLHSLGQFVQEGTKVLFETVFTVSKPQIDLEIPSDESNLDGLNYLAGKKMSFVNEKACEGTLAAHEIDGKVPNVLITMDSMNAFNYGYLVYFFEMACAMSAYLLGINPFNQPGVEVYKKNMFKLLGKF